jgi:GT2 family glycosyltransferase
MDIVALLTSHNRRELTVRCLREFFGQRFETTRRPDLRAVVVDDGSTDGTARALEAEFGEARVIAADGSLYWARGMQLAESRATAGDHHPAYLLWLNDDVTLDSTALERMLAAASTHPDTIIVGALRDPDTDRISYSGVRQSSWHPLRTRLVEPADEPVEADTFNGNVVLVPRPVYEALGSIDGRFSHAQADFDYGLRARSAGFRVVVAAGTVGTCKRGAPTGTLYDTTLSLRRRWQLAQSPKGLPMGSHARFLRRHGGRLWPVFWAAPYVKLIATSLAAAARRRLGSRAVAA